MFGLSHHKNKWKSCKFLGILNDFEMTMTLTLLASLPLLLLLCLCCVVVRVESLVGHGRTGLGVRLNSRQALRASATEISFDQAFSATEFLEQFRLKSSTVQGVYSIENRDESTVFVGMSHNVPKEVARHLRQQGQIVVSSVRCQTFPEATEDQVKSYMNELIKMTKPLGNLPGAVGWEETDEGESSSTDIESPFTPPGDLEAAASKVMKIRPESNSGLDLNKENIDKVLDEIRPYLIQDGGNVAVESIDLEARSIYLLLEGACGNCPSSTTTMRMGIERVLRENFTDLGAVEAVNPPIGIDMTLVEDTLSKVLPAISGMGGRVEIKSLDNDEGKVILGYDGPLRLRKGIELVLKDIEGVTIVAFEDI